MSTHKALVLEKFGTPLVLEDISNPTCYTWLSARCTALRDDTPATSSAVVWCFQGASYSCVARILSLPPDATTLQIGDLVWVDATIRSRDNPHAEVVRASLCGADPGSLTLVKSVWKDDVFTEKLLVPLEGIFKLEEKWVKGK
ncbi:hypothetical protein GGP41_005460 [Bipolaris sorokiniana]|uniref:Uncharacterized protein n=1 Tax=Cochliobolus sativus TaxID=45130 RepID=A0A8H5ZIR9_COCSA|nr:hypothetical protein GGP41_005460 [Bipolaris sorokiniana]